MTDARYPERWLTDRRLLQVSDAAHHLFVVGLVWTVSNRTDGVLNDDELALLPGVDPSRVVELKKRGLWTRKRDRWLIDDFATTQTSSHELEVLENIRRRDREKKARQRAKKLEEEAAESPGQSPGMVPRDSTGKAGRQEGKAHLEESGTEAALELVPDWSAPCGDCGWPLGSEAHHANCQKVAS